jgi:exo-beta-1,3-glucanase (GH17 family)
VVVTVVKTVYPHPAQAPDVIVFVDQFGKPVSTMTEGMVEQHQSVVNDPASPPKPSTTLSTAYAAPPVAYTPPVKVAPSPATSPASSPSQPPSSPPAEGSGFGFSYSPYNTDHSCKSQEQVNQDFDAIPSGYSLVRIYGTNCNQVATVLSAAKGKKMKLFAGIYYLDQLNTEVQRIITAANGDWSSFDTISVGNELVNSDAASPEAVVAAIGTARGLLKAAKYPGNIVTVDTLVAARAHPQLCDASDYCAVNCHPFFDGNVAAGGSGDFLKTQIPTLRAQLANKSQQIVVTETGWPWKGDTNGAAIPSPENQAAAVSSIKGAFSSNPGAIILFTAFNDYWKQNTEAQHGAEQYWGLNGDSPSG